LREDIPSRADLLEGSMPRRQAAAQVCKPITRGDP
jgi:hypothetical protein